MKNSEIKITTNIETSIFYLIVEYLKAHNWILRAEYDETIYDKGIDFDFYEFHKDEEKIRLSWNNWFEGEIQATTDTLAIIAQHFKIDLKYNEPEYLHRPNLIDDMKNLITFKK